MDYRPPFPGGPGKHQIAGRPTDEKNAISPLLRESAPEWIRGYYLRIIGVFDGKTRGKKRRNRPGRERKKGPPERPSKVTPR